MQSNKTSNKTSGKTRSLNKIHKVNAPQIIAAHTYENALHKINSQIRL